MKRPTIPPRLLAALAPPPIRPRLLKIMDSLTPEPDVEELYVAAGSHDDALRHGPWIPGTAQPFGHTHIFMRMPTSAIRADSELRLVQGDGIPVLEVVPSRTGALLGPERLARRIERVLEEHGISPSADELANGAQLLHLMATLARHVPVCSPDLPAPAAGRIMCEWAETMPPIRTDVIATTDALPERVLQAITMDEDVWNALVGMEVPPERRMDMLRKNRVLIDSRPLPGRVASRISAHITPNDVDGILFHGPAHHGISFLKERIPEIRLVYADPPWNTGRDFTYTDAMDILEWSVLVTDTVRCVSETMSGDANLLLHVSPTAARHAYPILEDMLKPMGELIWAYRTGGAPSKRHPLARKHDTILHFARSGAPFFNSVRERVYYERPFFTSQKDSQGRAYADVVPRDVIDGVVNLVRDGRVIPYNTKPVINVSKERVRRFHTQKPEGLLAFLLEVFTEPGDWVLDPFGGTGTTALASLKMGRRFVLTEQSHAHMEIIMNRLKNALTLQGNEPCGITGVTGWQGGGAVLVFSVDIPAFLATTERAG